jgi:Fe2+ transport system protein FeoA
MPRVAYKLLAHTQHGYIRWVTDQALGIVFDGDTPNCLTVVARELLDMGATHDARIEVVAGTPVTADINEYRSVRDRMLVLRVYPRMSAHYLTASLRVQTLLDYLQAIDPPLSLNRFECQHLLMMVQQAQALLRGER